MAGSTMVGSAWRNLQCKLGGACTPLAPPSLARRLQGYLVSCTPAPTTLLLTAFTLAVSATLLYFRPSPRRLLQKVKSVLRTGPGQAGEQQPAETGGVKVPPLGVPVYPPEVYQNRTPATVPGVPATE